MTGRQEEAEAGKENTGSYNFATAGLPGQSPVSQAAAAAVAADRVQNLFLLGDGAGPPQ